MRDYERIKETTIEDIIFIIYYGIITLSLIANQVERNYLKYKDPKDKENYRLLLYIIFGTATLLYIYYAYSSYQDLKNSSSEAYNLNKLSLIASILVLISGFIYLYIITKDKNISVELAFN